MRDENRILETGDLKETDQSSHMNKGNRTSISHLVAAPMTDPVESIYLSPHSAR